MARSYRSPVTRSSGEDAGGEEARKNVLTPAKQSHGGRGRRRGASAAAADDCVSARPAGGPKAARQAKPRRRRRKELRDRWLERVNAEPSVLVSEAKYDVGRRIEGREAEPEPRLLAG